MFRVALVLCGCPHDAEDLVQETLARVLARPRPLYGGSHARYLSGAVRKTFLAQRRAEARRPRMVALAEEVESPDGHASMTAECAVERIDLHGAITDLPHELGQVVVAVDVVGLSYREAARALRLPAGTVMSRLYRARQRLVQTLDSAGLRPSVGAASPRAPLPPARDSGRPLDARPGSATS
jgi:RNA polymerase sigma-70 factor (ECF subfamily)